MSNAFRNFLGGVVNGLFGKGPIMKDYQHADRVYVKNNYARTPKLGFLYFVTFNINLDAITQDNRWGKEGYKEVGLLVKRIDLPKFQISTETINQYNRKTVVQTALKYQPISIDFHDDNSNITRDLWKAYFQYYYTDSAYGNNIEKKSLPSEFEDTKYGIKDIAYGLNSKQLKPFIKSIDIYVLHQQNFTQYTLVNPLVNDWMHDSLDQADGIKILTNKMTVAYETVIYREGKITKTDPERFSAVYYDTSPSTLSIAGNGTNRLFGPGGILAGASAVFGNEGNILQRAIIGANVIRNARSITKGGLKQEGYSILSGVLGEIQQTGNQPGGVGSAIQNGINQRGIGINIFSNQNSSVNGSTQTIPKKLTGDKT
jgi:hypothetical protein